MSLLKPSSKSGHVYLNPIPTKVVGFSTVFKLLPEYVSQREETEPKKQLGPFPTDAAIYASRPASGMRVTWFGHSSSLIEIDGVRVLIDPVWDERAGPYRWLGPKRFFPPTLPLDDLPPIDVVLISHDHYDHLGKDTVRRLSQLHPGVRWVTSLGVGARLQRFGVPKDKITELDWTQSTEVCGLEGSLRITSWPSRHFSGRTAFDRFSTLWASFVLEGSQHRIYYGADSGDWDGFAEIAERYEGFDLTMLEIGAFHPLWASIHLGPDGAARAFQAMGGNARAGLLMPIHWGLFNLALHAWRQPILRLRDVATQKGLKLWSPRPGAPTEVIRGQELLTGWYLE
jgi:L-ascorbate metabolism protein UlaG (beta-lactamase superfamily)